MSLAYAQMTSAHFSAEHKIDWLALQLQQDAKIRFARTVKWE